MPEIFVLPCQPKMYSYSVLPAINKLSAPAPVPTENSTEDNVSKRTTPRIVKNGLSPAPPNTIYSSNASNNGAATHRSGGGGSKSNSSAVYSSKILGGGNARNKMLYVRKRY